MDPITKKLKAYSMLAAASLGATSAQAGIVYTDIPDTTLSTTSSYFLDLDNNGVNDYELRWLVLPQARGGVIAPATDNLVLCSITQTYSSYYPQALNVGNVISGSQAVWYGTSSYLGLAGVYSSSSGTSYSYGNFIGVTDKYLGLRFKIGGNWHHGWARLDVDALCTYMIIKDFAYETSPNTAINAGDMGGVGMSGLKIMDDIKMFNAGNILHIETGDLKLTNPDLLIHSVNGQCVFQEKITSGSWREELGHLRSGIYLVSLKAGEGIVSRKIIVE